MTAEKTSAILLRSILVLIVAFLGLRAQVVEGAIIKPLSDQLIVNIETTLYHEGPQPPEFKTWEAVSTLTYPGNSRPLWLFGTEEAGVADIRFNVTDQKEFKIALQKTSVKANNGRTESRIRIFVPAWVMRMVVKIDNGPGVKPTTKVLRRSDHKAHMPEIAGEVDYEAWRPPYTAWDKVAEAVDIHLPVAVGEQQNDRRGILVTFFSGEGCDVCLKCARGEGASRSVPEILRQAGTGSVLASAPLPVGSNCCTDEPVSVTWATNSLASATALGAIDVDKVDFNPLQTVRFPADFEQPMEQVKIHDILGVVSQPPSPAVGLIWRLYDAANLGPRGGDGRFPLVRADGTPLPLLEEVHISQISGKIHFTTIKDSVEAVHKLEFLSGSDWNSWGVESSDGISKVTLKVKSNGGGFYEATAERLARVSADGWDLIHSTGQKIEPYGGVERVTKNYENSIEVASRKYYGDGSLMWELNEDGSWVFNTYDGLNQTTYRPFGDTPKPWDQNGYWTPGSMAGIQSETRSVVQGSPNSCTVLRRIEGNLVSSVTQTVVPGPQSYTDKVIRVDGGIVSWTVTSGSIGETGVLGGLPLLADDGKGGLTAYQHSTGEMQAVTSGSVTRNVFVPSVGGSCLRTITSRGGSLSVPALPSHAESELATLHTVGAVVAGAIVRDVQIIDSKKREIYQATEILNSGNYQEATWTDTEYDENPGVAEVKTVSRCGRTISVTTSAADGSWEESVDETGLVSKVIRDAAGRTISETFPGPNGNITRSYTYSGLTTKIRTAAGSESLTTSTTLDRRGRMAAEIDTAGAKTRYEYSDGGRVRKVVRPGQVEEISTNYIDGTFKSRTGSGVIHEYRTLEFVPGGSVDTPYDDHQVETVSLGPATTGHSPRWTATTARLDGRVISVKRPGFPDGTSTPTDVIESYEYDPVSGSLLSVTSSAEPGVYRRFERDLSGSVVSSGIAFHSGALAPSSSDRYSTTSRSYEKRGSYWWEIESERTYLGSSGSAYTETSSARRMWTGDGEVVEATDAAGVTTTFTTTFPSSGRRVVTTSDPRTGSGVETYVNGFLESRTVPGASRHESYAYDALGRRVSFIDVRNAVTRTRYNSAGQVESIMDHEGRLRRYEYYPPNHASAGRVWREFDAAGGFRELSYDHLGNVTSVGGSGAYPVSYGYNQYGERTTLATTGTQSAVTTWVIDEATGVLVEKKHQGDGDGVKYTYTAGGEIASREWRRGVAGKLTTDYSYNETGDLESVKYSDDTPDIDYDDYDRKGRPTTITEHRGASSDVTELTYDPVTGAVSTKYGGSHSLLADLKVTLAVPDALGREKGYEVRRGDTALQGVEYGYDAQSRLQSVTSGGLVVSYDYYAGTDMPQTVTHTLAGNAVPRIETRHRDLANRIVGVVTTVPSGGARRVVASAGYRYNASGMRERLTREDGTAWIYRYNDRGEVISGSKRIDGLNFAAGKQFAYSYDGIGNREYARSGGDAIGNNLREVRYTPNPLNQYGGIETPGSFDVLVASEESVGVSANGSSVPVTTQGKTHRGEVAVVNSTTGVWVEVSVTSPSGVGTPLTGHRWVPKETTVNLYDEDGNLTKDGRWDYVWDAENRLVSMTTLSTGLPSGMARKKLEFSYDWLGRRIAKKVSNWSGGSWAVVNESRFLYEDWNIVGEFRVASGNSILDKTYLWGLDVSGTLQGAGGVGGLLAVNMINPSPSVCFPAYDGNGNILVWTATNGDTLQRMDYDPFGNTLTREVVGTFAAPALGFSTKYQDVETGLYYYGHRYYEQEHGRWLNRDPVGESGGLNVYGFVGNDPIGSVDLLGHEIITKEHETYRRMVTEAFAKYTGADLYWAINKRIRLSPIAVQDGDWWQLCVRTPGSNKWWVDLKGAFDDGYLRYLTPFSSKGTTTEDNASGRTSGNSMRIHLSMTAAPQPAMDSGVLEQDGMPRWRKAREGFAETLWHEVVSHSNKGFPHPNGRANAYIILDGQGEGRKIQINRTAQTPDQSITYMNTFYDYFGLRRRRPQYYDYYDEGLNVNYSIAGDLPEDNPSNYKK